MLSYDEETGEQGYKPVVRLFRNQTKEWYHVFVDGEEIRCTGEHPFYVQGKGFIPAKGLKSGDKCLLSTGEDVTIEKVEVESLTEAETTYNFEVADFHTYYVTEKDVLVHNKCITKLYRAMSNAEYGDLTKHGIFGVKNGTMAEKWMATTYDDAVAWGKLLYGEADFRIVEITVPTKSLNGMYYADYALDGIGHAYCANYKYLNEVMISFRRML